jgi:hypothetical protein
VKRSEEADEKEENEFLCEIKRGAFHIKGKTKKWLGKFF